MARHAVVGLAVATFVLLTVACIGLGGGKNPLVGEPAPAFAIEYRTKTVTLDDLRGQIVVLIFWSST